MHSLTRKNIERRCHRHSHISTERPIREGVLLIRPDTTLADVRKFGEECQRRWGITPLQIFLHKDEGHWLTGQPEAEDGIRDFAE